MDNSTNRSNNKASLEAGVKEILDFVDKDREYKIITRRFGLYGNRETLEQIGEALGVTRERVRQLEKSILGKISAGIDKNKLPAINSIEKIIVRNLAELGRISRTDQLTSKLLETEYNSVDCARVSFIATLAPNLTVLEETDKYYHSVAIAEYGDDKKIKARVEELLNVIKDNGEPITIEQLHNKLSYEHPNHVKALASTSKLLSNLGDNWGLSQWPSVNPRNIRDKIYVTLKKNGQPMHFSDIAAAIKSSDFKRKDVTVQAIHNELIKDSRFVLIGRGIYALESWGFNRGTVADIIADVLKKADHPMHREEVVREVLKSRHVKEATILLNLQNRPQFKRVAKATYVFDSQTN